jgi:flagellar biosynthetic protein FliR
VLSLLELYRGQLLVFLLTFTRIAGLVLAAPVFGSRRVPVHVRVLLAVAAALLVAPVHGGSLTHRDVNAELVLALFREALLGLVLGLALLILVAGLQAAGQLVGQMSGLSLAEVTDPDFGDSTPLIGRLYDLVASTAFVLLGGHRLVLQALLDSFRWMPPGQVQLAGDLLETLSQVAAQSFTLSVRVAAPVLAALLLATLVLGLIGRVLPTMNVFSIGFSLNTLLVMAVLSLSLGGAAWLFEEQATASVQAVVQLWESTGVRR